MELARELLERYSDLGLSLADASSVVLSHRYGILDILTLGERRFRVVSGAEERPFRLLSDGPVIVRDRRRSMMHKECGINAKDLIA